MDYGKVFALLRSHIVEEVLEGDDDGLEATSPLLEWGVLNSLEIARLLRRLEAELGVRIPEARITAANFRNLDAITHLVLETGTPA